MEEFEKKLATIIAEVVRNELNNKKLLTEMARVGVMTNNFDVVVYTDDMGFIPHVHIIDKGTGGKEFNSCVMLEQSRYFTHGIHTDVFNSKQRKDFNDFMNQPCRSPKYRNNYEFAVEMWNANNSSSYVQIVEDKDGNVIVPDYTDILPYK